MARLQANSKTPKRGDVVWAPIGGRHPAVVLEVQKIGAKSVVCLLVMGGTSQPVAEHWQQTCLTICCRTRFGLRMKLAKDTTFKAGDLHWFASDEVQSTQGTCVEDTLLKLDALHAQVINTEPNLPIRASKKVLDARSDVVKSPIDPPKGDD